MSGVIKGLRSRVKKRFGMKSTAMFTPSECKHLKRCCEDVKLLPVKTMFKAISESKLSYIVVYRTLENVSLDKVAQTDRVYKMWCNIRECCRKNRKIIREHRLILDSLLAGKVVRVKAPKPRFDQVKSMLNRFDLDYIYEKIDKCLYQISRNR